MHKIVMWMGGITAVMGLFFCLMSFIVMTPRAGMLWGLTVGGSIILSGAILYCFRAIVDHLLAIRTATEA